MWSIVFSYHIQPHRPSGQVCNPNANHNTSSYSPTHDGQESTLSLRTFNSLGQNTIILKTQLPNKIWQPWLVQSNQLLIQSDSVPETSKPTTACLSVLGYSEDSDTEWINRVKREKNIGFPNLILLNLFQRFRPAWLAKLKVQNVLYPLPFKATAGATRLPNVSGSFLYFDLFYFYSVSNKIWEKLSVSFKIGR